MNPEQILNPRGGYFFHDAFAVAKYVKQHFPKEAQGVIAAADNVAAGHFTFTLHWQSENVNPPIVFENEIDWMHQPGDDPEWVYAFNRMKFWVCLGQAYALTGDEKYAEAFVNQMLHWAGTIGADQKKYEKAWRSIEVGLRLEYWLKAMQYFKNSPAVTPKAAEVFTRCIKEHAEFIMGVWNTYNLMSNWGVLANHGLFMAGAMLPQTPRTAQYTAEAARRLTAEINMQVYRDGTHWEQSPMYHGEVLHCFLDTALLAQRCAFALPDTFTKKTLEMCLYSLKSAKPNHHSPLTGDSDDIDQRAQITKGTAVFKDPRLKARAHTIPDFETIWDIGEDGLKAFNETPAAPPKETDFFLENSGNTYMRSGWGENDTWVHFQCGPLGAGHGHADKLHVDITTRGDDILTDAGRYTYVFGQERIAFKQLRAHNTIMIDGKDLYTCKDSWECENLTRAVNCRFYSDESYAYTEGGHLGYLSLTDGVFINRRVIYLKPDIIVLADEFYTSGSHRYNQFFHFGADIVLKKENEKLWVFEGGHSRTQVIFVAENLSSKITDTKISRFYNEYKNAKGIETEFAANASGCVYTVFALGEKGETEKAEVKKLKVESCFKGTTFGNDEIEALEIKHGKQHFTLAIAHKEFATPTDTFMAGGCTGFGSAVVFNRALGENETGTVLAW